MNFRVNLHRMVGMTFNSCFFLEEFFYFGTIGDDDIDPTRTDVGGNLS